jgi:hypothetical protein
MALQPVYLVAAKNLEPFLEALRHAQAPEKVSLKFIESLGFKSTNDRLFASLLKAMKFTDDAGKPTARYHSFLDDTEWKRVLGEGIREAYADLFRINRTANALPREQLQGKLRSLGEGKLSPAVLKHTTKTFLELVKLADFSSTPSGSEKPAEESPERKEPAAETPTPPPAIVMPQPPTNGASESPLPSSLVYRIEIVLPSVRDQAVYDAIFRSVREHLIR